MTRRNLLIALMNSTFAFACTSVAQKGSAPKTPADKFALVNENAKELLLLMDTDKDGKISKQEWMKFMGEEFDRLDKDMTGKLDKKELLQSRMSMKPLHYADLGK
jgi:hypothetical protein